MKPEQDNKVEEPERPEAEPDGGFVPMEVIDGQGGIKLKE